MNIVSYILYGLLGVMLNYAGVSVLDKPVSFIGILLLVCAIDFVGRFGDYMIRKFEENWIKGFGIIPFGERELINLSWSKRGFNRNPEFGFSGHVSNDSGFFLGIAVWKMSIWLQIMGKTLEDLDTIDC